MDTTPLDTHAVRRHRSRLAPVASRAAPLLSAALLISLLASPACKPTRPAVFAPEPLTVETVTVAAADIPITQEWVATLDGSTNAVIRPQVSGYILRQVYADGTVVRKGDLLFEIDPRPFNAALEQARATLAQSEAQAGKTALDVKRYTPLAATDAISQQELDNAVQADLAAKAAVEAARAQVDKASIELGFTRVTAPIDGLAGQAKVNIGDLVSAATPELTTVSTINPIRAYFSPSEQEYLRYKQQHTADGTAAEIPIPKSQIPNDQRRGSAQIPNPVPSEATSSSKIQNSPPPPPPAATFTLLLSDGTQYAQTGTLLFVDREVDPRTGAIRLAALFPNPDNQLRPGMFARLRAVTAIRRAAIAVPQRAVIELQGTYQVLVFSPDAGTASVRPIKAGERLDDGRWIVLDGLKPGEQVIAEGIQKARPGVPLRAKPYGEKAEGLKD